MSDNRKIKRSRIPTYLPTPFTLALYAVLRVENATGWVWGVAGTLVALAWIAAFIGLAKEDEIDVFTPRDR